LVALIMVGLTVYAIFNEDFRKKMFGSKKWCLLHTKNYAIINKEWVNNDEKKKRWS
jgi:hypothetical protein